jgi:hypothetical protein
LASDDLASDDLASEDLEGFALTMDFLAADFLVLGLRRAGLLGAGFFKADLEREVILWETCVQQARRRAGASRFKSALIGFGQSAPIRDR